MGKRKKSSRKPTGPKKKEPLPSTFQCLFCNHEDSVTVKLDRKLGIGYLSCKICGQSYQTGIHFLSEGVDVYSDWIDACDAVANENDVEPVRARNKSSTYRGTAREPRPQAGGQQEEQLEDDFVVNDEEGMENDYGAED
ncbi:MAG: hypothetical protein Q9159_001961 [Coniocarpon cinnabarinum]